MQQRKICKPPKGGFVPGTWPSILEKIAKLEDPLRWELLAYSELPKEVSVRGKTEQLSYDNPDMARVRRVYHRFQQIQAAATYIGLLARPVLARPDAEATLDILESFVSSLRYAELPYLRQCGVCGKIFYAKRRTQKGCTTRHSTTLYKREQ